MTIECEITQVYALDKLLLSSLETYFGNRLTFLLLLLEIKSSTRPPSTCIYIHYNIGVFCLHQRPRADATLFKADGLLYMVHLSKIR